MSCQQKEMEVDINKSWEVLGFVPNAVSDSAWWHELLRVKYTCDEKCNAEGFKFFFFLILQPSLSKTMASRTRSTSVRIATTAG